VKELMQNAVALAVPLDVDVGYRRQLARRQT
jgi:hypothetical protein